jgi:hypothetical protein
MNAIYAIYRCAGYLQGSGTIGNYTEGKKVEGAYIAWFTNQIDAKRAEIALSSKQDYANQYRVEDLTQEDCEDLGFLAVFHSLFSALSYMRVYSLRSVSNTLGWVPSRANKCRAPLDFRGKRRYFVPVLTLRERRDASLRNQRLLYLRRIDG